MRKHLTATAAALALIAAPGGVVGQAPAADTSWVARSALYELFVHDFSPRGDFRGVIEGLDRVEASGANVVWLMPIHPVGAEGRKGTLGSPYAPRDYRGINPAFGTKADFRALVEAVHARGMKLILDWVPDHTSPDHPWIRSHPEYYIRDGQGQPSVPRDPDGKLTDWTDVRQLDFDNPDVRRAMIGEMRYWLQEFGVDGFRMDVAGFVPYAFWREAIPALRASVPRRILLLAEWGDPEMHHFGFDLTYGWDSYAALKEVWQGASAARFVRQAMVDQALVPAAAGRLRFTTNHDETAWDRPPVAIFGAGAGARAAFAAMALLPGRPLLYNGQEVESPQRLALFEREAIAWDQPQAAEARAFYRRVLELARTDRSLLAEPVAPLETSAPDDLIAYRRGDVAVVVNARAREVRATVTGASLDGARDLLAGGVYRGGSVTLPAHGILVLRLSGR